MELDLIEGLRELGRPEARLVGTTARGPTDQELRTGRFVIDNHPVFLRTPVDWLQDPFLSRSWCFQLNTLAWLKPLLLDHVRTGNRSALAVARDLIVDWATAHTQAETDNEFAWYDMVIALRCPYIAYALRACLIEDMLDESDALLLLDTAIRHGTELAKAENYSGGHNHGLFQDEGLYLLAQQLSALPTADEWRELALTRLRSTLRQTICLAEGGHLEHSSSYQFSITALVSRLAKNVSEMDDLSTLRERLTATSQWHVTPADRMAQLGDTDDVPAPEWASSSDPQGLNALLDTGRAFVRDDASYLAVSAAHHSGAHKQSDETGFLLVEDGTVMLGDAGRWSYNEDEPDRIYARSAAAHNVLTVDDLDFQWLQAEPYGSGLIAAGRSDTWYAIVARNPSLRRQGVDHQRLLLYRPGRALLVIDDVRSDETHEYARYFHLGPRITARPGQGRIALSGGHTQATLTDLAEDSPALYRGTNDPNRLGWTYPADRVRTAVSTAVFRTRAACVLLGASLTIGASTSKLTAAERNDDDFILEFGGLRTLEVRVDPLRKEATIVSRGDHA